MIWIYGERYKAGDTGVYKDCPPKHQKTVDGAMAFMLSELGGWGGRVSAAQEIAEDSFQIVINTNVLGCTDITEFWGPKDVMAPLAKAAAYFTELRKLHFEKDKDALLSELERVTGGNALLVTMAAGGVLGSAAARLTALLALDVQDETTIKACMSLGAPPLKDIIAAAILDKDNMLELLAS